MRSFHSHSWSLLRGFEIWDLSWRHQPCESHKLITMTGQRCTTQSCSAQQPESKRWTSTSWGGGPTCIISSLRHFARTRHSCDSRKALSFKKMNSDKLQVLRALLQIALHLQWLKPTGRTEHLTCILRPDRLFQGFRDHRPLMPAVMNRSVGLTCFRPASTALNLKPAPDQE